MTTVYVLRGVTAAAKNLKIERRGSALSEGDLLDIIRCEVRKRQEAEEFAGAALEACVRELLSAQPGAAMGQIVGALKATHAGRYDGREASELVRRVLTERGAG